MTADLRQAEQRVVQFLSVLELLEALLVALRELGMGHVGSTTVDKLKENLEKNAQGAALSWYRQYVTYSKTLERYAQ